MDAVAATGINPNVLTFFGMLVNFWAAVLFAAGHVRSAASLIFLAGFLDMLDGQVARREERVTAFGAFFDSTLDRYSDMALYMGLLVLLRRSTGARPTSSSPQWPRRDRSWSATRARAPNR